MHEEGWEVHGIIRENSNKKYIDTFPYTVSLHLFNGKIKSLVSIIKKTKPDVVFHIAGYAVYENTIDQVKKIIDANITFPSMLVEAMLENSIYNLINTGTSWQFYHSENYKPVNLYAATKQAFQDLLLFYTDSTSLKKELKIQKKSKTELSTIVAELLAAKAKEKKIAKVYFDRGVYKYHGRVKIFAEALRKNGLEF